METKIKQSAEPTAHTSISLDISLIGTYKLEQSTLHPTTTSSTTESKYSIVICRRRKPSKNKPLRYLMLYIGDSAKYLSSIYQQESTDNICLDKYIFEYDKKYYQLGINNCTNEVGIKFHNSY
jgi:hypothetical protein